MERTDPLPVALCGRTIRAVVFDLDDTLVVSTVDFAKFKRLVLDRIEGLGDDRSAYNLTETIVAILERFENRMRGKQVPEQDIRGMLAQLDRIMDAVELERAAETRAIHGAAETLRFLKDRGIKVGVLTRGCAEYAGQVMGRTGISEMVDAIECRNSDARPKPYPDSYLRLVRALGVEKHETVFVGDHAIDAKCAENAGIPFIGVLTGDVPIQTLLDAGAVMVIRDVGELRDLLVAVLDDSP